MAAEELEVKETALPPPRLCCSVTLAPADVGSAQLLQAGALRLRTPWNQKTQRRQLRVGGDLDAVFHLASSGLDVFAHNIEAVSRLQRIVRDPRVGYDQSMAVLKHAKTVKEMPTPLHLTVKEYVTPEKFEYWKEYGESIGFRYVASGPLVRSSYRAGEFFIESMIQEERKNSEL